MSPVRTTVHLVRHGEVHNPDKVLYGRLPGFGLSFSPGQTTKTVALTSGQKTTVATGWTAACSNVTIATTNGWDTNFDNLVYASP